MIYMIYTVYMIMNLVICAWSACVVPICPCNNALLRNIKHSFWESLKTF